LAKTVSTLALTKGVTAGGSTLALVKGALKLMAWSKMQTGIVVGAVVLLTAGTTTVAVKEIQEHRAYPWQIPNWDTRILDRQPPQVRILPSKIKYGSWGSSGDRNGDAKFMGTGVSAEEIVLAAYSFPSSSRLLGGDKLPVGLYDYIACLPMGNEAALQAQLKKTFGIVASVETQEQNVLLLEVQNPRATGLKPSGQSPQAGSNAGQGGPGSWSCSNGTLSLLADYLDGYLDVPVVDQTGITNRFDINLTWKQSNWADKAPAELKAALLDQLGLELVPTNMPVQMLVIEKAQN
jgi:uncharacterized protein (TIGR03435 family)